MAQVAAADVAMLSLEDLYHRLEAVQPTASVPFSMDGTGNQVARFSLYTGLDLNVLDLAPEDRSVATLTLGDTEYGLTNNAVRQVFKTAQISPALVKKLPVTQVQDALNWIYSHGTEKDDFQAHITSDNAIAAFSKGTIVPFSNTRLLDEAVAAMRVKYGQQNIMVDKHIHNTLDRTAFRLIVPDTIKEIRSLRHTAADPDAWSVGVQVVNSLTGRESLKLSGFVFAYWCTNGATTELTNSGVYDRRHGQDPTEAYEWARDVVEEVLGGMESELDRIDHLTHIPLEGDITTVINDVFATHRVPQSLRRQITDSLVESDDLTAYGLMNAITSVANNDELSDREVSDLFRIGGEMPHTLAHLCQSCHRPV